MNKIDEILRKIEFLPPFPYTIAKVMEKMKNPAVSYEEIADIIKLDPSIATNMLRLCNSSFFGLKRKITSINEAIVYIGLKQIRKILFFSGSKQYFEKKQEGYEFNSGELLLHSVAATIIGEKLREKIGVGDSDLIFISTLLHDIGKIILSEYVYDEYSKIDKLVNEGKMTFNDAEVSLFTMDHAEIGAKILELWKFTPDVISAVKKHHTALTEEDTHLDNIVRLADTIAMTMGIGTSIDGLAYSGFSEICRKYSLNNYIIDNIMAESLEEIKKIQEDSVFIGRENKNDS
jgi:putative nucleotidyltransferase with HDIG domain